MKEISISIEVGNIINFKADVIALKYAQGFFGADKAVVKAINKHHLNNDFIEFEEKIRGSENGVLIESSPNIAAAKVFFLPVVNLYEINYDQIRKFSYSVLANLSQRAPDTKHIAMTLHGVNIGLDEAEALRFQYLGLLDAIKAKKYPGALSRITFVELDEKRADRLKKIIKSLEQSEPADALLETKERQQQFTEEQFKKKPVQKPHIFIAMPFSDELEDVFYYGIQSPVNRAGYLCERVDFSSFTGEVMERVKEKISTASFVIAEVSTSNPNVFLEIGYAWGKGRPTILITRDVNKLPFDVKGHRCLVYSNIKNLEKDLFKELQGMETEINEVPNLEGDFSVESDNVSPKLLKFLRREFQLSLTGIHGFAHWKRVWENGLLLAKNNEANKKVVELFAFIHDSERIDNGFDPDHGKRAVDLINRLNGSYFNLTNAELEDLKTACANHSEGLTKANITIQTCWDADRLDLGRIGVKPDPRFLCTEQAKNKEVIEAAFKKARGWE